VLTALLGTLICVQLGARKKFLQWWDATGSVRVGAQLPMRVHGCSGWIQQPPLVPIELFGSWRWLQPHGAHDQVAGRGGEWQSAIFANQETGVEGVVDVLGVMVLRQAGAAADEQARTQNGDRGRSAAMRGATSSRQTAGSASACGEIVR
jgi:hypothetical protein